MRVAGDDLADPSATQRWIVGCGLPGVSPGIGVSVADLRAATGWATQNRLTGLVFRAASGLGVDVPDDLVSAHVTALRQGLVVEAEACRAVAALRSAGVDPIVFKGVASAHLDYEDPGNRTFYDVDLLVSRADFVGAVEHLARSGWTRGESPLSRGWQARFARAAQFVAPSGVEIDLHASLAAGYFGVRLDHERLTEANATYELGGVEMRCFDTDARLLASCYALVLSRGGNVRLVRDVAQQLICSGASPVRAGQLAGEGDVVIAAALELASRWVDLPAECLRWARTLSPTRAQRRGLALAAHAHDTGWRNDAVGELLGLKGGDRVRYAAAVGAHRVRSRIESTARWLSRSTSN